MIELDDIDLKIFSIIQANPNSTHTDIAQKIDRSQPTVGTRIKKLEKSGILKYQAGLNLKTLDLFFGVIHLKTLDIKKVIEEIKKCPYMIHSFQTTGAYNFIVIAACKTINQLEHLINHHFRQKSYILASSLDIVTEMMDEIILPISVGFTSCECDLNKLVKGEK